MTSRRRLKKEIDYLVSDLVIDCLTYTNLAQKPNEDETFEIVRNTLSLRDEMRSLANHPEKRNKSEKVKKHYGNIAQTLVGGINDGYEKLRKSVDPEKL